jgi:hypothetical protein
MRKATGPGNFAMNLPKVSGGFRMISNSTPQQATHATASVHTTVITGFFHLRFVFSGGRLP